MKPLLVCVLFATWAACDSLEDQAEFEAQAFLPPSRYTQTTISGDVISTDSDDWRTSPTYRSRIEVMPAFPNPPGTAPTVTVPFRVLEFDIVQGSLELVMFDDQSTPRRLDGISNARSPGAYVFKVTPSLTGASGLIRVFIVDTAGTLVSYGDIQFSN